MNVVVNLNDGKNLDLSFDPFHKDTVKQFYVELFAKSEIRAFNITYNDGTTFGLTRNVQ